MLSLQNLHIRTLGHNPLLLILKALGTSLVPYFNVIFQYVVDDLLVKLRLGSQKVANTHFKQYSYLHSITNI